MVRTFKREMTLPGRFALGKTGLVMLAFMFCALRCDSGRQLREKDELGMHIRSAVDNNVPVAVRDALDEGFDADHVFSDGWRLLHVAAKWDEGRVLRLCFDAGRGITTAGVSAARNTGSVRERSGEIVSLLIGKRADVNGKTADGATPLHIAVASLKRDVTDFPSIPPVEGRISSRFGWRGSPFDNNSDYHRGLDISARNGTPVRAAADGIVAMTGMNDTAGNYIVLQHREGVQSLYGHCHLFAVRKNTHVRRGAIIGYVGSSGAVSGDHCHYEVRVNGAPVDPLAYINQKERCDVQHGIVGALVGALLLHKAAVNARDGDGRTALIECAGKSAAISRLLVEHGADINAQDDSGISPLHEAAAFDEGLARYLIGKGARVTARTSCEYCAIGGQIYRSGTSPLTVALKSGNTAIAELLKHNGAIE